MGKGAGNCEGAEQLAGPIQRLSEEASALAGAAPLSTVGTLPERLLHCAACRNSTCSWISFLWGFEDGLGYCAQCWRSWYGTTLPKAPGQSERYIGSWDGCHEAIAGPEFESVS